MAGPDTKSLEPSILLDEMVLRVDSRLQAGEVIRGYAFSQDEVGPEATAEEMKAFSDRIKYGN